MRPTSFRWHWLARASALLLALPLYGGCKTETASDEKPPNASAAAARRPPQPAEKLQPPPLQPPPEASPIAGGGHIQILRQGQGQGPRPNQLVEAEVSIWTAAGKLVESSRTIEGPADFQMRLLSPGLQAALGRLGPGSSAILWVPERQVAGFKPPSWPRGELVIEIEVLALHDDPEPIVEELAPAPSSPKAPPPDLVDAPDDARRTSTGLRYVVRRRGGDTRPASPEARLAVQVTAFALRLEVETLFEDRKMTFTPKTAPGGLGEVLATMSVGSLVRVWVPADRSGAVLPGRDGSTLVLDIYLHAIE